MALRRRLRELGAAPEWGLLARSDLLRDSPRLSWVDRIYRRTRSLLAALGLGSPYISAYDWLPGLKHRPAAPDAKILLIWALDCQDRETLRQACLSLQDRLSRDETWIPVLVTSIADFAFFSRLGWLVEYVPELHGTGDSYAERKARYLAWRYRDSCAVPLSAGGASDAEWEALVKRGTD
jgi:hypothetical protein